MGSRTASSITVAAPKTDVMAVIADFAEYPQWATALKSAEVLETGPGGRAAVHARRGPGAGHLCPRLHLGRRLAGQLAARRARVGRRGDDRRVPPVRPRSGRRGQLRADGGCADTYARTAEAQGRENDHRHRPEGAQGASRVPP